LKHNNLDFLKPQNPETLISQKFESLEPQSPEILIPRNLKAETLESQTPCFLENQEPYNPDTLKT
jgi:hypothetical protein